jgi:hypothetical protein
MQMQSSAISGICFCCVGIPPRSFWQLFVGLEIQTRHVFPLAPILAFFGALNAAGRALLHAACARDERGPLHLEHQTSVSFLQQQLLPVAVSGLMLCADESWRAPRLSLLISSSPIHTHKPFFSLSPTISKIVVSLHILFSISSIALDHIRASSSVFALPSITLDGMHPQTCGILNG